MPGGQVTGTLLEQKKNLLKKKVTKEKRFFLLSVL
jgi:hypothetical protein